MGPLGVQEVIVIFLIALLLFGPRKLPELGKTIGKALTEFRRAQSELKSTFETHMRDLERENESIKEATKKYTDEIYNQYTGYDSSAYDSTVESALNALNPSTEASPSTVGAPAIPGAESSAPPEAPTNGTVPRTTTSQVLPTEPAIPEPAAPESHSIKS